MLTMFPTPAVDTIARCSSFFEASPLGDFGAELSGIDLSAPISSGIAQELRSALARFQVLVFRNQSLNPSAQEELTRCFGDFELSVSRRP
ncbi:TauD/TfdA dioxygenase family protein, partial [Xanthomonas vasicola]